MARNLAITFAGGGNRSFFQMGLMNRWADRLVPRLAVVSGCSAGAMVATLLLSGRHTQARSFWGKRRRGVTKNFEWSRLLYGKRPTPHAPIYHDTMVHAFSGGGLERIRAQPFPVLVTASALPRGVPAAAAVPLAISAYSIEKRLRKHMVHPTAGRRIGFAPMVYDARDSESPEELADLILASSATPPFTPVGRYRGRPLLDGGMVDNVPAFAVEDVPAVKRHLVLLSRPYPNEVLGWHGHRLYLAPSRPVPVERWDYTRPHLVDDTIEMGEREADLHAEDLEQLLSD